MSKKTYNKYWPVFLLIIVVAVLLVWTEYSGVRARADFETEFDDLFYSPLPDYEAPEYDDPYTGYDYEDYWREYQRIQDLLEQGGVQEVDIEYPYTEELEEQFEDVLNEFEREFFGESPGPDLESTP